MLAPHPLPTLQPTLSQDSFTCRGGPQIRRSQVEQCSNNYVRKGSAEDALDVLLLNLPDPAVYS